MILFILAINLESKSINIAGLYHNNNWTQLLKKMKVFKKDYVNFYFVKLIFTNTLI